MVDTEADAAAEESILIMDGGMGTTLEDVFAIDVSSSTLWSSLLLTTESGKSALTEFYAAFLAAGAQILQTCTYQASFEAFEREGIDRATAAKLMRDAVQIAQSVCCKTGSLAKVLLSLSSHGASIVPASQEYTGNYPVPFGPISATSQKALEQWHYDRVSVFAADETTWSKISYLAIETIPLLSEAEAVCAAIARVRADVVRRNSSALFPLWYVSFVFPNGQMPQGGTPSEIVQTLASTTERPDGIGINCTKLRFLPEIVTEMTQSLRDNTVEKRYRPFLVLYPDGGLIYDTTTRTWSTPEDGSASMGVVGAAQAWADKLTEVGRRAMASTNGRQKPAWSRLLLGGCCKAGPEYIKALSRAALHVGMDETMDHK